MLAWMYDEDKWPSGFGGGYVTKKKENRQKFLMVTTQPYAGDMQGQEHLDASGLAARSNNGTLYAKYEVVLDDEGYLTSYRRLAENETAAAGMPIWKRRARGRGSISRPMWTPFPNRRLTILLRSRTSGISR